MDPQPPIIITVKNISNALLLEDIRILDKLIKEYVEGGCSCVDDGIPTSLGHRYVTPELRATMLERSFPEVYDLISKFEFSTMWEILPNVTSHYYYKSNLPQPREKVYSEWGEVKKSLFATWLSCVVGFSKPMRVVMCNPGITIREIREIWHEEVQQRVAESVSSSRCA